MPFTFDFRECQGTPQDHPFAKDHWHPVAAAINQMAMFLGYNSITEANVEELARRFGMYQKCEGPLIRWQDDTKSKADDHSKGKAYITVEDLRLFIGYRCNASSKTAKVWDKDFLAYVSKDQPSNWSIADGNPSAHAKYGEFAKRHMKKGRK